MAKLATVTPDELRRAFVASNLAFSTAADEDSEGSPIIDVLSGQFAPEKTGALLQRLMLISMWLGTEDNPLAGAGNSPLGLPDIHPAVFDVAASCPMPSNGGLPSPTRFIKDVENRLRVYETLSG